MAFSSKNTIVANNSTPNILNNPLDNNSTPDSILELSELDFLLKALSNVDLKGSQVELFYNLIIKLQNQYLQKQQNK
jgi:hypothetical protein